MKKLICIILALTVSCHDVLDSYDAVESIGAVVSRLRELSPEELQWNYPEAY